MNTTVQLPPNGILDYTTVNIPYGVTVSFTKNAANTPVVIRASGDVTVAGAITVSAQSAPTNSGTYGDGNLGDDTQPGIGGPGGFDGGFGGMSTLFGGAPGRLGGAGKGPGGGAAGSGYDTWYWNNRNGWGGGGGGFGTAGSTPTNGGAGGAVYGQASLLPLIGGSGGGGGAAGETYSGAGGGGGGGALLIASSGTITIGTTANSSGGRIYADASAGGYSSGSGAGGNGGGGSGGAIRLIANTLACPNSWCLMQANGANGGSGSNGGGNGGSGIIRLEANTITGWNTSRTSPDYSFGLPGHVLVPNNPTLAIVSVTASATTLTVPANPTGNADITFPTGTTAATVNLEATNIPAGATADVYVIPAAGASRTKVLSTAFSTPDVNGISTATATVTLSPGNNVLQAAVTYTVTELVAMSLPQFNGEYVARIRVEGGIHGAASKVTYITASGKEYPGTTGTRKTV